MFGQFGGLAGNAGFQDRCFQPLSHPSAVRRAYTNREFDARSASAHPTEANLRLPNCADVWLSSGEWKATSWPAAKGLRRFPKIQVAERSEADYWAPACASIELGTWSAEVIGPLL